MSKTNFFVKHLKNINNFINNLLEKNLNKLNSKNLMLSIKPELIVSSNSAVIEKKPAELKNKSPKYKVLLHNDPVNSMEYVTISLREVVPQLSEQDAIAIMLEAHNTGVGLVIVCDLEPAEFYSESLKSKGISSSIEKED